MLKLRATLHWTLPIVLLLTAAGFAPAQEAEADQARARLAEGIKQFNSLQFEAAKATLLKVDADALPADRTETLNEYLRRVDTAINKQRQARQALRRAREAMEAGDFDKAVAGLQQAAASEYLPEAQRTDARADLALARRKAQAAGAETETKPAETPEADDAEAPRDGATEADEPDVPEPDAEEPAAGDEADAAEPDDEPDETGALSQLAADRSRKARQLMRQAKQALGEGQMNVAAGLLERVLSLQPDNAEAAQLYEFARRQAGAADEAGALSEYERTLHVARQVAEVEIDAHLKQSRRRLGAAERAEQFDESLKLARKARAVLENNQNVFPASAYRRRMTEIDRQIQRIQQLKKEWNQQQIAEQRAKAAEQERKRQLRETQERQRKIAQYERDIRTLREEYEFERALDVTSRLLTLDPRNDWALDQRDILEQFVILKDRKASERMQVVEEQKLLAEVEWKEVPWHELLHFPDSWEEIRKRAEKYGAVATGESEANRIVRQELDRTIDLDVDAVGFQEVINFLRNVSGVNFWVNWKALDFQGVTTSTEVTAHLSDVSVRKALQVVLADAGGQQQPLEYIIEEGVVTISTRDDLSRKTTTRVYDINHLLFRVPNWDAPRSELQNVGDRDDDDDGGGGGFGGTFGGDDGDDDAGEENYPTKQEMIDNLTDMIESTIDPPSWQTDAAIREMHGHLIVTQTAKNHQELAKLLNSLRESRGLQVAIEARFISVSTGFLDSIGIDFDVYFNLGSNLNPNAVVADPFTGAQVPTIGPSSWQAAGHDVPGGTSFTPMGAVTGGGGLDATGFGNVRGTSTGLPGSIGTATSDPAFQIAGVFLDDIQVDFLLEATQAHRATRTLTAPRVTIWNGQRAYVTVATQRAYIAGYEAATDAFDIDTDDGDATINVLVPDIQVVATGTTLDVEATVTDDRKYVIMTVQPQVTTLDDILSVDIPALGPIELPILGVQELRTTVMVPDRGTLLLGGQSLAGEIEQELGVPLLSKIPVVNRLYTNRGTVRDQQTLLVLIRPEIIIHEHRENKAFPP
ncbi:MAG: hypothetical protein ACOC8F_03510 [Planctomycetota bacterium]